MYGDTAVVRALARVMREQAADIHGESAALLAHTERAMLEAGIGPELAHYVRDAEVVDASADPSIREQVQALHRQGFLSGRVTASQVFQVTR